VVVISIALGDLAFLVLRLARGAPLLCYGLVPVKNRILRERRAAGTRWAHFNYNGKKARRSAEEDELPEDLHYDKSK
jgi:hypothetical protein